eukprot:TRINITY_DN875_c0_g1_i1.p1 TRINITY_DN875_c0_g1~~TRINITY_DN875_c0_g1_i1.p1  ORF type:complete len:234 (-),score=58.79 TRINITY_DN875_c0_g1_i1:119-769(-)
MAANVLKKVTELVDTTDEYLTKRKIKPLEFVFEKASPSAPQLKRVYIVLAVAFLLVCLIIGIFGLRFFTYLVAFVPIYHSFLFMRGDDSDLKARQQWVSYWIIVSTFALFESFVDLEVSYVWIYYWLKIAFLVFCFHRDLHGALIIYDCVCKYVLKKCCCATAPATDNTAPSTEAPKETTAASTSASSSSAAVPEVAPTATDASAPTTTEEHPHST